MEATEVKKYVNRTNTANASVNYEVDKQIKQQNLFLIAH